MAAIRIYASTNNFTALHLVTTTHALRLLAPFLSNPNEALRYYWQAVCAAYISIGAPVVIDVNLSKFTVIPWNDIFSEAVKNNDDHVIKLVYSCYMEDKIYHNSPYNYVAAKAVENQK